MYLIVIGWLYVALMMAVAEATNHAGTVVGAIITFLLYGVAPLALVVYLIGTPGRRKAIRAKEAADRAGWEQQQAQQQPLTSGQPDARGEAAADAVAPVRKES